MLIAENVAGVEDGLGGREPQVAELRFALMVEADDFAIKDAAAALQVTRQSFAHSTEALERIAGSRDEPGAFGIGTLKDSHLHASSGHCRR